MTSDDSLQPDAPSPPPSSINARMLNAIYFNRGLAPSNRIERLINRLKVPSVATRYEKQARIICDADCGVSWLK